MTDISEDDIVNSDITGADITEADITATDIPEPDKGGSMTENIVLTEATYYILLALLHPQHGYGIMQEAERLSNGRVRLAAGTLYGALNTLCEKKWITQIPSEAGSRKKEYQLTRTGFDVLLNELERLRELVANGDRLLDEIRNEEKFGGYLE